MVVLCLSFMIYNMFHDIIIGFSLLGFSILLGSLLWVCRYFSYVRCFRALAVLLLIGTSLLLYIQPDIPFYYLYSMTLPLCFIILLGKFEGGVFSTILLVSVSMIYWFSIGRDEGGRVGITNLLILSSAITTIGYISIRNELMFEEIYKGYEHKNSLLKDEHQRYLTAQQEVRTLTGTLPVCSSCGQVRDEDGNYTSLETYIRKHTDTAISHGLCPDCLQKLYPDISYEILQKHDT